LLTILNQRPITAKTKTIRLRIQAEAGLDPQTDIDIQSLRFGASEEVNFGRGSKVLKIENEGKDLIVTFEGKGNGIREDEFAPKLIGRYKNGNMLYGYARLPDVNYEEPILSARAPVFTEVGKRLAGKIEVQNFGQVRAQQASLKIAYKKNGEYIPLASAVIPMLKPYEKIELSFSGKDILERGKEYDFLISIGTGKNIHSTFHLKKTIEE